MTETLTPIQRFENFLEPFRAVYNERTSTIGETISKAEFDRDCIMTVLVKSLVIGNPILRTFYNDIFHLLDATRLLQQLAIQQPEVIDDARDELLSIIKEVCPSIDLSILEE